MLEEFFQHSAEAVALGIETVVVLVLAYATIEAFVGTLGAISHRQIGLGGRREVWLRFAMWIVLALEFALAADIIRSAIAPSWDSLGQLAAIALIRTFLNWFLVKDIEAFTEQRAKREREDGKDG